MTSKKKMHFAWFLGYYYGPSGWDSPTATAGADWRYPEAYQQMAQICERGFFDLAVIADRLGVCNVYEDSVDTYVKYGFDGVCHDSTVMAAMIAAGSENIGVATTVSTSLSQPYLTARQTASLDHVTRGRAGFNIVTTATGPGYEVLGIDDAFEQGDRYERADEYMELCHQLWDSWEPDALVMGKDGVFADPSKVHTVDFDGKFYKCKGPLNVVRSPQGRPSLCVAGTSERGREFAAKWADCTIAAGDTVEDMKAFYDDIKARAVRHGRNPDDLKVFFGLSPVFGETEEIAQHRLARRPRWGWGPLNIDNNDAHLDGSLAQLSYQWNLDMSQFPLDEPLPELEISTMSNTQAIPFLKQYYALDPRPTVREMAMSLRQNGGGEQVLPVGTYEQVADRMEEIFDAVGGDGFFFRVDCHNHAYMAELVNGVIPILQERGRARTEYTGTTLRENLLEF